MVGDDGDGPAGPVNLCRVDVSINQVTDSRQVPGVRLTPQERSSCRDGPDALARIAVHEGGGRTNWGIGGAYDLHS